MVSRSSLPKAGPAGRLVSSETEAVNLNREGTGLGCCSKPKSTHSAKLLWSVQVLLKAVELLPASRPSRAVLARGEAVRHSDAVMPSTDLLRVIFVIAAMANRLTRSGCTGTVLGNGEKRVGLGGTGGA